jgi:hypothetical protein
MALGALGTSAMIPGAVVSVPQSFSMARGALGALLVGVGASLGNGCTSGHGISGNARLAKRSMVYTYAAPLPASPHSLKGSCSTAPFPCPARVLTVSSRGADGGTTTCYGQGQRVC